MDLSPRPLLRSLKVLQTLGGTSYTTGSVHLHLGHLQSSALSPRARRRSHTTAAAAASQVSIDDYPLHDPLPGSIRSNNFPNARKKELQNAKPFSAFLTDTFSRQHDYLRISITERCNLRCLYCMPEEGVPLSPPSHLLTTPEITHLSSLFVSQGVTKIRLTGGEPTVRHDILPLMHNIGALRQDGLKELCITTNGITLYRKLDSMVQAGLTGVNLSLDTLDPFQFQIMTRRKGFEAVMKSITRILEMKKLGAGIKLKINCVIMRSVNEREILPFVEMGREKDIEVRFIEYMPFDGNKWSKGKMMGYEEMLGSIRAKYPGLRKVKDGKNETSKTFEVPGFVGRVGFITSMTENFCGSCNRLRITSDGNLKVCLFGNAEVSLRDLLRQSNGGEPFDEEAWESMKELEVDRKSHPTVNGMTPSYNERDQELLEVIGMAVKKKKAKHAGMGQLENMKNRPMILIGGSLLRRHAANLPFNIPPYILPSTSTPFNLPRHFATISTRAINLKDPKDFASSAQSTPSAHTDPSTTPNRRHSSSSNLTTSSSSLPHLTPSSAIHIIPISSKPSTKRIATAIGYITFSTATPLPLIRTASLKKGDVLSVARVAAVMAVKKTAEIVPLCHSGIGVEGVSVTVEAVDPLPSNSDARTLTKAGDRSHSSSPVNPGGKGGWMDSPVGLYGGIRIIVTVECTGKTGVEMEALTGVVGAALSVLDMVKGVDKGCVLDGVRVVRKEGGRSGRWVAEGWEEEF